MRKKEEWEYFDGKIDQENWDRIVKETREEIDEYIKTIDKKYLNKYKKKP